VACAIFGVCGACHFGRFNRRLKKKTELIHTNPTISKTTPIAVEIDEQWSYTGHKRRQCWTIYVLEKESRKVVAFVCGRRTKKNVIKLLKLLKPFKISCFYTDGWKVYPKLLLNECHIASKTGTQRIERNNLNFRTRAEAHDSKNNLFPKESINAQISHCALYQFLLFLLTHKLNTQPQHRI
jgi:insertion element IS1 protein InsB